MTFISLIISKNNSAHIAVKNIYIGIEIHDLINKAKEIQEFRIIIKKASPKGGQLLIVQ